MGFPQYQEVKVSAILEDIVQYAVANESIRLVIRARLTTATSSRYLFYYHDMDSGTVFSTKVMIFIYGLCLSSVGSCYSLP